MFIGHWKDWNSIGFDGNSIGINSLLSGLGLIRFFSALPLVFVSAAAQAVSGEPAEVIAACVPQGVERVLLDRQDADGIFAAPSGQRFFMTDVQLRLPGMENTAFRPEDGLQALDSPVEAIPAAPVNRWGIIPAWIVSGTGETARLLQAEYLESGAAVFAPRQSTGRCAGLLRQAERKARDEDRGLWADSADSPIRSAAEPAELELLAGRYVIVRGRIVSLGKTRSTRYLNFGYYWKTDFTATLKSSDEEAFDAALLAYGWRVEALAGKRVELRGVIQRRDGPYIALRHPEQLVVLESKRAGRGVQNSN